MANYCNFCGKPLDDGALKCSACGKEVGASQPENNNSEATGNTEKKRLFLIAYPPNNRFTQTS